MGRGGGKTFDRMNRMNRMGEEERRGDFTTEARRKNPSASSGQGREEEREEAHGLANMLEHMSKAASLLSY